MISTIPNTIKFTDSGSVVLALSCDPISTDRLLLKGSVKDSGKGITASKIPLLFAPFSQEDTSINRRFGGAGLGLLGRDDRILEVEDQRVGAARMGLGDEAFGQHRHEHQRAPVGRGTGGHFIALRKKSAQADGDDADRVLGAALDHAVGIGEIDQGTAFRIVEAHDLGGLED